MPCTRFLSVRISLLGFVLTGVAACGSLNAVSNKAATVISPYKIDIVQGNVVTREQVAVLKPGMPRAVVRDVLGSSLLTSLFHADRWDYVFTLKRQGGQPQERKVTVFFKNDVMERVEADDLPSEAEFVSTLKSSPKEGPLPAMEASRESLREFPPAPPKPAAPVEGPAPAKVYPPLESPAIPQ